MYDDFSTFKEEVKGRIDIADVIGEYVELKKRGSATIGLCPFHNEKTPSFNVNRAGQFYYCFGCGKGGDVISFLMDITGMSFLEAIEQLTERAGLEMPRKESFSPGAKEDTDRIIAANLTAAEYFHLSLSSEEGKAGMDYLLGRGLTPETIRSFRLGFAPEDSAGLIAFARKKTVQPEALEAAGLLVPSKYGGPSYNRFGGRVIFPIIDQAARIIGFGGRILAGEGAKYVNSPESPVYHKSRVLFGLYQAKAAIKKLRTAVVVEGYMDVISLHQAGITHAIASSGTSFTTEQGRIIARLARSALLLFDGDSAGLSAAVRGVDNLLATDLSIGVVVLPEGHDPDSYVREYGAEALQKYLEHPLDIWEFKLQALKRDAADVKDKIKLAGEIADSISLIPDELKRDIYINDLSFKIGVDRDSMRKAVDGRIKKRAGRKESGEGEQSSQLMGTVRQRELLAAVIHYPDLSRRLMEELGSKPFGHPAMKAVADIIFHRLVEGLDVSPSALMNVVENREAQQLIASAAMIKVDRETAEKYIADHLSPYDEPEIRSKIEELRRRLESEKDTKKREALKVQLIRYQSLYQKLKNN
ncbi:MAG: DNA primase [Candidatus Latescibacter sp.]|nr:DNA primase [Candidatus Latescibacter sp.]